MRNLIKKILKEDPEFHDTSVGDIYSMSEHPTRLLRIENINCYDEPHRKEVTIDTFRWGKSKIQHDGCYAQYKASDDNGKSWHWPDGDDEYKIEKNWINFIVKKGFWNLEVKGDVDFFLSESEDDGLEWVNDLFNGPIYHIPSPPNKFVLLIRKQVSEIEVENICQLIKNAGWDMSKWGERDYRTISRRSTSRNTSYIASNKGNYISYGNGEDTFFQLRHSSFRDWGTLIEVS